MLRYIESADGSYLGGYLPAGVFSIPPIVTEKGVTLAATTLAGESSGDGTLVTVSFEVITVKESVPTLSNALLTQGTGKSVIPQIVAAQKTKLQEGKNSFVVAQFIAPLTFKEKRRNELRDYER